MKIKLASLLVMIVLLFGCSSSLNISDFDDTKDIAVMNDILTEKSKKLNFELTSIKEKEKEYILSYKHEDGSALKFIYNKEQQIKALEFLKNGEQRKAAEAYGKITFSTLDVFQDLREDFDVDQNLMSAYPNGKGTYSLGKTRYGECVVRNQDQKFVISFDHQ
ncbi:MAG: hypothetical protein KH431_08700 [Erysipelotrichaceae bacterium]|nr:hypothetical protein [Erysipelotrichaceae bacterium]